jgi:hypothetical protein
LLFVLRTARDRSQLSAPAAKYQESAVVFRIGHADEQFSDRATMTTANLQFCNLGTQYVHGLLIEIPLAPLRQRDHWIPAASPECRPKSLPKIN